MPATIPSLWPDDIKVDVLPPLTILKLQAAKLREITRSILRAEVTTVTGSDDFVAHSLDLIAQALDGRRIRILTLTHRTDLYPIVIEADCFRPRETRTLVQVAGRAFVTAGLLGNLNNDPREG